MGMQTNLVPMLDAHMTSDVFHVHDGCVFPAMFMMWGAPRRSETDGDYSPLPFIQYLDEDGEPYSVADRPDDFEVMQLVSKGDLMVMNERMDF